MTPTLYASTMVVYDVTMLITTFVHGSLANRLKLAPNKLTGYGLVVTGICNVAFGLLMFVDNRILFLFLAFTLKLLESIGCTCYVINSYSFLSSCFTKNMLTNFARMEMCYGMGTLIGPFIGGLLYNLGGFALPFFTMGLMVTILGIILLIPPIGALFRRVKKQSQLIQLRNRQNDYLSMTELCTPESKPTSFWEFLKSPIVLLDFLVISVVFLTVAFCGINLEPFMRHGHLSNQVLLINMMFVIGNGTYAVSAFFLGKLCDRFPSLPPFIAIGGCLAICFGIGFLAPLPMLEQSLGLKVNMGLIAVCMFLIGFGSAAKIVGAYTHAMAYTIRKRNFPPNQQTHAFLSGMFLACEAFGGMAGQFLASSLIEHFTFQYATRIVFMIEVGVLIVAIITPSLASMSCK